MTEGIARMTDEATPPRRRCRPPSERHRKRRHGRGKARRVPVTITVPFPADHRLTFASAGQARGISAREILSDVIAILAGDPALLNNVLDDGH
jgi:hypothetical protein